MYFVLLRMIENIKTYERKILMYYYFRFHKFLDNFFFWPWKIFKFCFDKTNYLDEPDVLFEARRH